jgi:hypothetical protein
LLYALHPGITTRRLGTNRAWGEQAGAEDFTFCRRWRDMGGKVFVDRQCRLGHLGQHLFQGDVAESLRLQGRW